MSKFNIFTIDLHVILSIIVATGVYALLLKFLQKKSPHDVQTKGGRVKGLLNNVKKNCTFLSGWLPLSCMSYFMTPSSKHIICKIVVLCGRGRGVNNKWTIVDCSAHVQGGVCPQPHCLGPVNSGHVRRGGGRPRPDIGCPRPLDTTHKVHRCVYYTFR